MNFEKAHAYDAFVTKNSSVGIYGEAWDVIGEPLNRGVDETLPAYDAKLELNLRPKSGEKRQEVNELRWGKIKKDAAKIEGLGLAMENIASVIKKGKDQLAHDWKGESFEAFKTAIERVEKTLTDYAAAAKTTATGLTTAMTRTETLYKNYQSSSQTILTFSDDYGKPNDWRKVTGDDINGHLVDVCPCSMGCNKDEDEESRIIRDKIIHPVAYKFYENVYCGFGDDSCKTNAHSTVNYSNDMRDKVAQKINQWYVATDNLRHGVDGLQTAALENLRIMSELKVFGRMKVPGAPGQQPPGDGKDKTPPGGGGGGGGGKHDTGGGGGGGGMPKMPETPPTPPPADLSSLEQDPTKTDPPTDPTTMPAGTEQPGETVTIEEGDRKISVTSPDSEGKVKVTVDDGTGTPKTYTMDFGQAGTPVLGPDGKPVLGPDGQPVMSADGKPVAGTEPVLGPDGKPVLGPDGLPVMGGQTGFGPDGQPVLGPDGQVIEPGADGKCVISDPPMTITAERPGGGDVVLVTVDDGTGDPTSYTLDYSEADKQGPTVGQPAAGVVGGSVTGGPADPVTGTGASGGVGAPGSPDGVPAAGFTPPGEAAPAAFAAPGQAAWSLPGEPAYGADAGTTGQPQMTSAQSVTEGAESFGSAGGVLNEQSKDFGPADVQAAGAGEAGLSSASGEPKSDSQPGGAAGSGMGGGMMGGGGGGGGGQGGDSERAGSQWRTTGNLFDEDYADSQAGSALYGDTI
ncbi:hypothetical protein [Alloactinosynnema sp. L-07]|uniref:hypothetical protein n=1 Tax=Alloactinosynnema sp. L-07 TaxID=1653480 RepID=UPI00065EF740|nr:hypothetical protein [Alloactinosynnema sp. L-07]CRK59971.1 hypothetical protein [Alloactinosynnema sp. L-07]